MARVWIACAAVAAAAAVGWYFMAADDTAVEAVAPFRVTTVPGLNTTLSADADTASRTTEATPPTTSPLAPQVVLTGVVVGANGAGNLAIVALDHRPEVLLRVGDALGSSAKVVAIDDASMSYRIGGNELRVFVKPSPTSTEPAKPDVPPKQRPGFVAAAPAMARVNGAEPGSGNDAFRQAVEKKVQAITQGR